MSVKNAIEIQRVFKTYPAGVGQVTVLKDVSLMIKPGELVGVVGPSGSGKSTLLNIVAGIDRPTQGDVTVGGETISRLSENDLARWRRRQVGVVFQFFQLLPMLTVLENVVLPMDFGNSYPRAERRKRAMRLLEMVGVADQAYKLPSKLSGGQQQRAAIARALANDPPLIVADEPTGNLDSITAMAIFELFRQLAHQGKTLFIITHDLELSARMDRGISLRDGCIQNDRLN